MIYTTYFAKLKNLPENVIPISICAKAPSWYNGAEYKQLAPTYELLIKWKETYDKDYYTKCFRSEILSRKDVANVIRDLQTLLPLEVKEVINFPICFSKDYHIVLVCYEKSSDFCHRHLVSEWFKEKGIKCSEYNFNERGKMMKIISAKEARAMRNNANENKEKLLEIQDKIIKEIEKEDGRDWININKISDTNFKILTSLGYSIKNIMETLTNK